MEGLAKRLEIWLKKDTEANSVLCSRTEHREREVVFGEVAGRGGAREGEGREWEEEEWRRKGKTVHFRTLRFCS